MCKIHISVIHLTLNKQNTYIIPLHFSSDTVKQQRDNQSPCVFQTVKPLWKLFAQTSITFNPLHEPGSQCSF